MEKWRLEYAVPIRDEEGRPAGGRWAAAGEAGDDDVWEALLRLRERRPCVRATKAGGHCIEMRRTYTAVRRPL